MQETYSLARGSVLRTLAPCAVLYATADVAEILANSGMDPNDFPQKMMKNFGFSSKNHEISLKNHEKS